MPPVLGPVSPSPSRLWSWAAGSRSSCAPSRSEEHTSELQSQSNLVCRLLLEKKKETSALLIDYKHCLHQKGSDKIGTECMRVPRLRYDIVLRQSSYIIRTLDFITTDLVILYL